MTVYVFILRLFSSQNQRQEKRYQESDYEVENSSDEDRNVNMSCQDSHDDCCRRRRKTEVEVILRTVRLCQVLREMTSAYL